MGRTVSEDSAEAARTLKAGQHKAGVCDAAKPLRQAFKRMGIKNCDERYYDSLMRSLALAASRR